MRKNFYFETLWDRPKSIHLSLLKKIVLPQKVRWLGSICKKEKVVMKMYVSNT